MLWAARQLLTPTKYLRVKHGEGILRSKAAYDYVLPIALAALTCGAFLWLEIPLSFFDYTQFVTRIIDLLELMIVFYVAALAAVATFERKGIDKPLKGTDATLRVRHHDSGKWVTKKLTYRQFISYLFGYLSFLSLCLYIVTVILAVGWPALKLRIKDDPLAWIVTDVADPAFFFLVFFALWQLTLTSLLGIYFLTERIQTLNDSDN